MMEIPHLPGDPGDPFPTLLGKEPLKAILSFQAERTQLHTSATSTEWQSGQHRDKKLPCSLLDCPSPYKQSPPCSPEKQPQALLPCEPAGSGTLPNFSIDWGAEGSNEISTLQCLQRWRED